MVVAIKETCQGQTLHKPEEYFALQVSAEDDIPADAVSRLVDLKGQICKRAVAPGKVAQQHDFLRGPETANPSYPAGRIALRFHVGMAGEGLAVGKPVDLFCISEHWDGLLAEQVPVLLDEHRIFYLGLKPEDALKVAILRELDALFFFLKASNTPDVAARGVSSAVVITPD